jgi:hypothetical protein
LQRISYQSGAVVLEHYFFRVESANIGSEKILVKFRCVPQRPAYAKPAITSIADNLQEPGARITPAEVGEMPESAQVCFLDNVVSVLLIAGQPARKIVSCVKVRQGNLLKTVGPILRVHRRLLGSDLLAISHCCRQSEFEWIVRLVSLEGCGTHTRRAREASLVLLEVTLPAVSDGQSAMEELVGFFPWNLKADELFARGNGLLALTASDRCWANHKSPLNCPGTLRANSNRASERA